METSGWPDLAAETARGLTLLCLFSLRKRGRDREKQREGGREREGGDCVRLCVCVRVCVRERGGGGLEKTQQNNRFNKTRHREGRVLGGRGGGEGSCRDTGRIRDQQISKGMYKQ